MSVVYKILSQTGVYADDCKLWCKKPGTNKTWPNFKQLFTIASPDLRQSKSTTRSVIHHDSPYDPININHILNTITTAMEPNQSTFTQMTNHNHHFTSQLNLVLSGLGTVTNNIATLQTQLNVLTCNGIGGGGRVIGIGSAGGVSNTATSSGGTLTGVPEKY